MPQRAHVGPCGLLACSRRRLPCAAGNTPRVGEEDVHRRVDLLDDREFVELEVRDLLEEDDDRPGRFPGTTR